MTANDDQLQDASVSNAIVRIRANAESVVHALASQTQFEFGFDSRSVEWLDGYINRMRSNTWSDNELGQLVSNLGSYLGEAMIGTVGGEWAQDEHGWHIRWDERNRAYPFAKVAKQFENGPEDSIYSFYSVTRVLRRS